MGAKIIIAIAQMLTRLTKKAGYKPASIIREIRTNSNNSCLPVFKIFKVLAYKLSVAAKLFFNAEQLVIFSNPVGA